MAIRKYKTSVTNPSVPKPGGDTGSGRVYTGGTPDFDERTGLYRPGSPNEYLNIRGGERGGVVKPRTPRTGIQPPRRRINPGGPAKPEKRPLPKPVPGKPGRVKIMPVPPKGKKPSRKNDTIKAKFRPDGTRVLQKSGKISNGKR